MGRGGASRTCCEPRVFHGNIENRSCGMQGNFDDVVIIDLDSDGLVDVIIIDVPDSLQQKFNCSSVPGAGKRFPIPGIISIEDDNDEEDIGESDCVDDHLEFNVEGGSGLDDYSNDTKNRNCPPFDSKRKHEDADVDDCRVVSGERPAFKLSKCNKEEKRMESISRNRHDLNFECESESGSSDCEVIEGSLSELREQWLKAFRNRRSTTTFEDQYYPKDRSIPCSSSVERNPNVRVENSTKDMSENVNLHDVNSSQFTAFGDGSVLDAFSSRKENPYAEFDEKIESGETCLEGMNFWFDECQSENGHITRIQNERDGHLGPSSSSIPEGCIKQCHDKKSLSHRNELRTTGEDNIQKGDFTPVDSNCGNHSNLARHQNIGWKKKDVVVDGNSSYAEGQNPITSSSSIIPINEIENPLGDPSAVLRDIINKRENLKETDEFKRAIEEEWAARQRQLQIQAEEAQRLRKRKKAESLRILDMEKRLKLRLEEVRETQRKDEENLNMKENLRAEVRKELYQLEFTCTDMASLLRGLGIAVGGGLHPMSQEVHAAYRRALLKFHPDRASKTDVHQQVEAEEKFKLISRMKEKFLSTS